MADCVRKGRFLPPENLIGKDPVFFKRVPQQVFPHPVGVEFLFGVNLHHVPHKVKIAEGNACLQGVHRDAAVRTQHVVHVQLVNALFALQLKRLCRGGKVGVFIAEQFIGDLPGQQYADVGILVNRLAAQVHAEACPDGCNVPCSQQTDDFVQRREHILPRHVKRRVLSPDVIGGDLRILQVNGIQVHADGKGADLSAEELCRNRADQAGIQPAREQKTERCVGVQPFFHAGDQLLANLYADRLQVVMQRLFDAGQIRVADEILPVVIMTGREGQNAFAQTLQVLRLTREGDAAVGEITVVQRANADRIPGRNQTVAFSVVEDHGIFRIEL